MYNPTLSQVAECADELTIDLSALAVGYNLIGELDFNPVHIIFDNQGDVAVEISKNGSSTWRTFPAGEALILDMRANHGAAKNYSFPKGTKFYAQGNVGTGQFSISYTYALE